MTNRLRGEKLNFLKLYPLWFESNLKPTPQMYVIFSSVWMILSGLIFVGFGMLYTQRKLLIGWCVKAQFIRIRMPNESERNAPCYFVKILNDKLKRRKRQKKNTHTHTHTYTRTTCRNTRSITGGNITAYRVKLNELGFWFSIRQMGNGWPINFPSCTGSHRFSAYKIG